MKKRVLTEEQAHCLAELSKAVGNPEWHMLFVIGWVFWMRMQSECIGLECGTVKVLKDTEVPTFLSDRHSAVVLNHCDRAVIVRWRRRKNRMERSVQTRYPVRENKKVYVLHLFNKVYVLHLVIDYANKMNM